MLDSFVCVSSSIGDFMAVGQVNYACSVMFMDFHTLVNLVIQDMLNFDVILILSWLSLYHVVLKFNA